MARSTRGAAWSLLAGISLLALVLATAAAGGASSLSPRARTVSGRSAERELISAGEANEEGNEAADEVLGLAEQYADIRTLPAESVSARAMLQARVQAAGLGTTGGAWSELTNQPYNSDALGYRDPIFSNSGGGSGLVAGRIQALAVDGSTVYAGAADGGVWRSTDAGRHWLPVGDGLPSLSSGALAVDPESHDVWYGTGEAATSADEYLGAGVFESSDGGATWTRVGGDQLDGTMISAIVFDGRGRVYAATSKGVYRRRVAAPLSASWERVLRPGTPGPYGFTFTNDVAVQPGTHGRVVIASLGWRTGPTDYNGFYVSRHSGDPGTWTRVHTTGKLRSNKIGRASFAYSADGSRLYALVESWQYALTRPSALYGIFLSESGRVSGPWKRVANWHTLANSGSALKSSGTSYAPGVQAWYNQAIGVDPHDPDHVYVGLEEVYETTDGGASWHTIGPYWNFTIKCYQGGPEACPNTTHPDQHAVAFGPGVVYMGNDGGVYRRSLSDHARGGWTNLNNGLHTLQYYFAGAGRAVGRPVSGDMVWGGLQDNGVSLIVPGSSRMVSPFGGDGGDVYVDPANGDRAVVEYVLLDMALTTNGGESDGSAPAFREISPSCYAFTYTPDPCDPNPRFIAPFVADPQAPNDHWVAGGQYVWET
ncbi:MAG TPA: glycosyl hydrolase, partial [Actinomycetota bacterium]|nr:glycosyl hydrolase [Actinomycetota bacterium]